MKKFLTLIFVLLFFPSISFAAIDAAMVWEVRAEGNQLYGGGYSTGGTDYSQFDSCKASWVTGSAGGCAQASPSNVTNDLASADPWTTLTSAAGGFTAAMIGNVIHITAGTNFIPGWYEIKTYVSANEVTVDRACGSAGAASAGTGYLGGAFKIGGTLDDDFFESIVKGNNIYVKTGTYTTGETIVTTPAGDLTTLINIIGYTASRNDATIVNDRPLFAIGDTYSISTGNYYLLKNIRFAKTGGSGAVMTLSSGSIMKNCKVINTTGTANQVAITISGTNHIIGSEFLSTNGYAVSMGSNSLFMYGSYIHDSILGVYVTTGSPHFINNIFDTNATAAIQMTAPMFGLIYGNTFYNGSGVGKAIDATTGYRMLVMNNIFEGFDVPIEWDTNEGSNYFDYNAYYDDVKGDNVNVIEGANSFDLSASCCSGAAGGDFTVTNTDLKGVGFPGTFVEMGATSTISYPDIGAVQRIEPAGGAGGGAWAF